MGATNLDNTELKMKFLSYYRALPIQKLAAEHIGRAEETIINWKKNDPEFATKVSEARSNWARENTSRVRSREWLLERVMKDHFALRTEHTGAEGEALQLNIYANTQLEHTPDGVANPSVLTPGEVQGSEVRETSGEDLPSSDDNPQRSS